jgi:hypothetical protein
VPEFTLRNESYAQMLAASYGENKASNFYDFGGGARTGGPSAGMIARTTGGTIDMPL